MLAYSKCSGKPSVEAVVGAAVLTHCLSVREHKGA